MTQNELISHWRKGANDALEMAFLAEKAGKYDHALFNCHLAVEKAFKAQHIAMHKKNHPRTHDLVSLAALLKLDWTEEQKTQLETLTRFVIDARYSDPSWTEEYATKEMTEEWIRRSRSFLSMLKS